MADTSVTFAVKLDDQITSTARRSAASLAKLQEKIQEDQKALSEMNRAMRRLKGSSSTSGKSITDLKDKITAQKAAIAQNQEAFLDMGGSFTKVSGSMLTKGGAVAGLVGGALVAAAAAAAAAVVALTAALAAATAALFKYGVAAADAARSERLHFEGLASIRRMYGLAAESAGAMQSAVDRVSSRVALGRGELVGYAERLQRMGVSGKNFELALEAAGTAAAVQGDRYGRRMLGMAIATARAGGSVKKLSDDVEARLGGIARKQMLSLSVQSEKLRDNLKLLVNGLRIEGFLGKIAELGELFNSNTESGRALKTAFEFAFQPLVDLGTAVLPVVKEFMQGMILGFLEMRVRILQAMLDVKEAVGPEFFNQFKTTLNWVEVGRVAFTAMAAGIEVTVKSILLMIRALKALQDFRAQPLGKAVTDGIADGITGGRLGLLSTVTSLAGDMTSAFTGALGIRSPSRVFAGLGQQIPKGIAVGVEQASPVSDSAVAEVVQPPQLGGGEGGGGGQRVYLSFGDINVGGGAEDPEAAAISFRDQLARVLEGVSIELGSPVGRVA